MPRTIQYNYECQYRPTQARSGEWVWEPYIDAVFAQEESGKSRRGIALVDSGAAWCAMPRSIAVDWFDIDVGACPLEYTEGITGQVGVPYATFRVKAFGLWATSKVLLIDSGLYLIGRIPFFSLVGVGFFEDEVNRSNNRILYT
jgi:hypothetical protein